MTPPRVTEAQLQAASAKWLALKLPKTFIAIHVPNEGRRSWAAGKRLKSQGMTAGVPDWLIIGGGYDFDSTPLGRIYAVELKSRKGSLAPAQRAFHARLAAAGVPVAVCRSLEEIEAALKGWGVIAQDKPSPGAANTGAGG